MRYRGYSGTSADDIRRSEERITQLQVFLNTLAPWYGEHPITPTGIWGGETAGLYNRIMTYDGYPGTPYVGMWEDMHEAWGISEYDCKKWEWAITIALSRIARRAPVETELVGTIPGAPPGEEEEPPPPPPENGKGAPWAWILGIGGAAAAMVGIIWLSRR